MNYAQFLKKNPTVLVALLLALVMIMLLSYVFSMPPDIRRILGG